MDNYYYPPIGITNFEIVSMTHEIHTLEKNRNKYVTEQNFEVSKIVRKLLL